VNRVSVSAGVVIGTILLIAVLPIQTSRYDVTIVIHSFLNDFGAEAVKNGTATIYSVSANDRRVATLPDVLLTGSPPHTNYWSVKPQCCITPSQKGKSATFYIISALESGTSAQSQVETIALQGSFVANTTLELQNVPAGSHTLVTSIFLNGTTSAVSTWESTIQLP
jgi:hypothetical protein